MGWASTHIEKLMMGETVSFRPRGNSMSGKISSGDLCVVAPITCPPSKGDIVLCTVRGRQYLHIVKVVRDNEYQIGNNHGLINGWTSKIHGILISSTSGK